MEINPIQLLLDCLHTDSARINERQLADLPVVEWQALVELAQRQGVGSTLYYVIKTRGYDQFVPSAYHNLLRNRYLTNSVRHLVRRRELAQVAGAMQDRHIPLLVLKGAFLAEVLYSDAAMREMGDMDLLVPAEHLREAVGVLEGLGFTAQHPYQHEDAISVLHHLPGFIKSNGTRIELHWTFFSVEEASRVKADSIWDRAQSFSMDGVSLLGLCPEDLLLHVCGHASHQHTFEMGLRSIYDVAVILGEYREILDWEQAMRTATDWRWQRGAYLMLRMAHELLGAPLPEGFLSQHRPSGFEERLYETACDHLLSSEYRGGIVPKSLASWHIADLPGKMSIFWHRLFLPKRVLAAQYQVPSDSPLIYFYYLPRLVDLLKRYLIRGIHLLRGDSPDTSFVEQKARLLSWLQDE